MNPFQDSRAGRIRVLAVILVLLGLFFAYKAGRLLIYRMLGSKTVADVVRESGPAAEARMKPYFEKAEVSYPPSQVALLAFKQERQLELWARQADAWVFIRSYPILAASGGSGPKLQEGDMQVPEGVYSITHLNPNSSYYLSLRLDYPNDFDKEKAEADGRSDIGGDIYIHGRAASIGCIAIGDEPIEELFVTAATIGRANLQVIIAPNDLRQRGPVTDVRSAPSWLPQLYRDLTGTLKQFSGTARHHSRPRPNEE